MVVIARVSLAQDDNDFDDFDMYEETVPEIQKPSKAKDEANKNNFVDNDADDGLVEDEFDHFSDKDEFEGFGGADSSDNIQESADLKKTGEPTLTMTKVPMNFRTNWDSYYVEILFVAGKLSITDGTVIDHRSYLCLIFFRSDCVLCKLFNGKKQEHKNCKLLADCTQKFP